METLNKKISLEPYITRFPVCYPSLFNGEVNYLEPNSEEAINLAHYGKMPLGISEESIGKDYDDFTEDMREKYGGKVLSYAVLQRWFTEMLEYRKMLYSNSCHGKFDNLVDYYTRTYGGVDITNAQQLDEIYQSHGGDEFYRWLTYHYFVLLDLEDVYYIKAEIIRTDYPLYSDWCGVMMNLGTSKLTYPAAMRLYGKFSTWHELYSEMKDECSTSDSCCDCVDYWSMGGNVMYQILSWWTGIINRHILEDNEAVSGLSDEARSLLYPEFDVSVNIKSKVEDFGVLSPFSVNFNPYITYTSGETCIYDDDVWIKTSDTDYAPPSGWTRYSEYYYREHPGETIRQIDIPDTSGRTTSSLDDFVINGDTVDNLGNLMPGYFRPSSASTVVQPAENSLLSLPYVPGKYANASTIVGGNKVIDKVYFGDVLYSIRFYGKDINGDVLNGSEQIVSASSASTSDFVMEKLQASADSIGYPNKNLWDMNATWAKKITIGYDNSTKTISQDGIFSATNNSNNNQSKFIFSATTSSLGLEDGKRYTVKVWNWPDDSKNVIIRIKLSLDNISYTKTGPHPLSLTWQHASLINGIMIELTPSIYISGSQFGVKIRISEGESGSVGDYIPYGVSVDGDGKLYADFTYYKGCTFTVGDDKSISVSGDTHLTCVDHCTLEETTCQYHLSQTEAYPVRYYKIVKDEESVYSDDQGKYVQAYMTDFFFKPSGFTQTQNVVCPVLRKEELLDFSMVEKTVDNIYIDRGYVTVLDKLLRIGEVRDFEQLENYGNKMFDIYNADEGII